MRAERSLAASHAASGAPAKSPAKRVPSTTAARQSRSCGMKAAARSTTFRTGVHLWPIISGFVTTAPSQWKKFRISGPPMPGKKYLFPPEKPTTSCGKTGPITTI